MACSKIRAQVAPVRRCATSCGAQDVMTSPGEKYCWPCPVERIIGEVTLNSPGVSRSLSPNVPSLGMMNVS